MSSETKAVEAFDAAAFEQAVGAVKRNLVSQIAATGASAVSHGKEDIVTAVSLKELPNLKLDAQNRK